MKLCFTNSNGTNVTVSGLNGEHIIILRYLNSTEQESVQTTYECVGNCRYFRDRNYIVQIISDSSFVWVNSQIWKLMDTPVLMVSRYRIIKQYGFSNYCFTDNNNTVYSGGIRFEWLSDKCTLHTHGKFSPDCQSWKFSDICINGNAFTQRRNACRRNIQRLRV